MTDSLLSANAGGAVYKTGKPFTQHRYTIYLEIDDVLFPELHLHARTRFSAKKQAKWMTDHVTELLEVTGMMGTAYQRLLAKAQGRPVLPAANDVIYLTKDIGEYKVGTPALVMHSVWDEETDALNQYPVSVSFDDNTKNVPLALDEFSTEPVQS